MLLCRRGKIDDDNLKKGKAVNMISLLSLFFYPIHSQFYALSHQKSLSAIQCKDDDAVKHISEGVLSVFHNSMHLKSFLE